MLLLPFVSSLLLSSTLALSDRIETALDLTPTLDSLPNSIENLDAPRYIYDNGITDQELQNNAGTMLLEALQVEKTYREKLQNATILQQLIDTGILSELDKAGMIVKNEEQRERLASVARTLLQGLNTPYYKMQLESLVKEYYPQLNAVLKISLVTRKAQDKAGR